MSFKITNQVSNDSISKQEILNSDFVKGLNEKHKARIALIFDAFNTKKAADGAEEVLDKEEQQAMVDWFQSVAGKDDKVTRKELRHARKDENTKEECVKEAKFKDYKKFVKAFCALVQNSVANEGEAKSLTENETLSQTKEVTDKTVAEPDNKEKGLAETVSTLNQKPQKIKKVSQPKAWQKANPTEALEQLDVSDGTADKVLEKLMEVYGIEADKVQMDKLKADLIKYNPSIFDKDGNLYSDVEWGKLDFPKNAAELYKTGAKTPTVEKLKSGVVRKPVTKSVKKEEPAEKSVQTEEAASEVKRDEAGNEIPGNVTAQFIKRAPAIDQPKTVKIANKRFSIQNKGTDFSNPLAIGVDFKTGANLNLTPLVGIPVRTDGEGEKFQEINGKTYYYDNNLRLIKIIDKANDKEYVFYGSTYEEYGTNKGIGYNIYRNLDGTIFKYDDGTIGYYTEEPGYGRVYRNPDGTIATIEESGVERYVVRDANGKVKHYTYSGDVTRNPDGTPRD